MADHRHRGRPRDTRALQIPDRRSPEVVRDARRHDDLPVAALDLDRESHARARGQPRAAEKLDPFTVAMKEPRDDAALLLFELPRPLDLSLEHRA